MANNNNNNNNNETTCKICTDEKALVDMFTSGECSHFFCKDCISNHIAAKVEDNIANVKCPQPGCDTVLEPNNCHSILPKNVLDLWGDVLCEAAIVGIQKLYCPFVDCSVTLIDDGGEAVTEAECPSCKRMFCAKCNVEWHGEVECEEFQKLRLEEDDDLIAIKFAEQMNWKRCPHCRIYVDRIEGCPYINCRCGSQFCYSCGDKWGGDHACSESTNARRYH